MPGVYFVSVTDRCMYSHTFQFGNGEPFTTGCTAVVEAKLFGPTLGPGEILIDICLAQRLLREVMAMYDHKNLDTLEEFQNPKCNTTVEVMAHTFYQRLFAALSQQRSAGEQLGHITKMEITVRESDVAHAGYFDENSGGLFP